MQIALQRRAHVPGNAPPAGKSQSVNAHAGVIDETLAGVAREMTRELQSDGTLVLRHDSDTAPTLLVAHGACLSDPEIAYEMAEMADVVARDAQGGLRSRWHVRRDLPSQAILITAIPVSEHLVTVTTLYQRMTASTRMQASEATARLLPLLQPLFQMWALQCEAGRQAHGYRAALNESSLATMLVDQSGHLIFANTAAQIAIARDDGIRCSGTRLAGSQIADTLRLQAAIGDALSARDKHGDARAPIVVTMGRRLGRPLLASIVPTNDTLADGPNGAILYIVDPGTDMRPMLEPVCRLYGLSLVETRLSCLLADGRSLTDAAAAMNVREQTARSYLKQIFQKTDTNRQAELVWLLLKSSVPARERSTHCTTPIWGE